MRNFSIKIFAFIKLFYQKYMKDRTVIIPIYTSFTIIFSLTFLAFILSFFSVAPTFQLKQLSLNQPFHLNTRDSKIDLEFTSLTTERTIQCPNIEIICSAPLGMEYVSLNYVLKNQGSKLLSFSIENPVLNGIDAEQYGPWFFLDDSEQNLFFQSHEELKGKQIFLLPVDTDILTITGVFRITSIPPKEFTLILASPQINDMESKLRPRQRNN